MPETKYIKKPLLPIYNNGVIEPALYILIRELDKIDSISDIILITNEGDKYTELPSDKIRFAVQKKQDGLGNAIYQAHEYITEDYFMLLLGDMIYKSYSNISCSQQLIDYFNTYNKQIIGLKKIPKNEINLNGMIQGIKKGNSFEISKFIEKPELKYALKNKIKYGTFGNYILSKKAMDFFSTKDFPEYMKNEGIVGGLSGLLINGTSYDIGVPNNYYNTFCNYSKN